MVPPAERDAWVDARLGLGGVPEDGPDLPRGCVPYLPCPVATVQRALELARVGPEDVLVDVGAGVGRVVALAQLLTGARSIGIEIQEGLVRAGLPGVELVRGDAPRLVGSIPGATVFFLYCPFSGERLLRLVEVLEQIAAGRAIRVCCVDLPLPPTPWLERVAGEGGLEVFYSRSTRF